MPLFSVRELIRMGYLPETAGATLVEIRRYNPLLFDFVLKRSLNVNGKRLSTVVFESRRVFNNRDSDAGCRYGAAVRVHVHMTLEI